MINHAMMTFIQLRTDENRYCNEWNCICLKTNVPHKKEILLLIQFHEANIILIRRPDNNLVTALKKSLWYFFVDILTIYLYRI